MYVVLIKKDESTINTHAGFSKKPTKEEVTNILQNYDEDGVYAVIEDRQFKGENQ